MTKPRLMWLLCLVALAAMLLAGGRTVPMDRIAWTLLGGVLAVGASGVFNNVLERDVDEQMNRTADLPLVEPRVSARRATGFGIMLAVASLGGEYSQSASISSQRCSVCWQSARTVLVTPSC